jgi:hypothetical protein
MHLYVLNITKLEKLCNRVSIFIVGDFSLKRHTDHSSRIVKKYDLKL